MERAKIQKYNKEYYDKNKKKILEGMSQNIICEYCGGTITKQHLRRHQRTKICQEIRKNKEQENIEQQDQQEEQEEQQEKQENL